MPGYAGNGMATLIRENRQVNLFDDEVVAVGVTSIAVQLERIRGSYYPWGLSAEVVFSGPPGDFEIDIMGANNDNLANYVELGSITTVNTGNVGRWDMPSNLWPKYVAAYVKTLTNDVAFTFQVTR